MVRRAAPTRVTPARSPACSSCQWGFQVSPLFIFRTALPVSIIEGRDLNGNSENNDLPALAYAFDGMNDDGTARVKEIGDCETYNCGRGAARTQFNLRGSKTLHWCKDVRIEAIAEVFNLFNALNPNNFNPTRLLGHRARRTPASCSRANSRATSRTRNSASARSASAFSF